MSYLTRDEIKTAARSSGVRTVEVDVPDWGGKVLIRELSADEVEEIGYGAINRQGKQDVRLTRGMRMKLIMWAVIEDAESLKTVFALADLKWLGQQPHRIIDRVSDEVADLSDIKAKPAKRLHSLTCPNCDEPFEVDLTALVKEYDEAHENAEEDDDVKN